MVINLKFLARPTSSSVNVVSSESNAYYDSVGRGISRPFRRDGLADVKVSLGSDLTWSRLGQILGTLCIGRKNRGEVAWRPEFGSQLPVLRFQNINEVFVEVLRTKIVDAIARWEPNVRVDDTEVIVEESKVTIKIHYTIVNKYQDPKSLTSQVITFEVQE